MNDSQTSNEPAGQPGSPASGFRVLGKQIDEHDYPAMHAFLALVSGVPADYRKALVRLVDSREFDGFLLSALSDLAGDERRALLRGRDTPTLSLWRDRGKVVALSAESAGQLSRPGVGIERSGAVLVSLRNPLLIAQLGCDPVRYTRYRFAPAEGLAVFEPGCRLRKAGSGEIGQGQVALFDDPAEVIDFHPPAGGSHLTLTVVLRAIDAPLVWLFDRASMQAVRGISASDAASRAELLVQLFETLRFAGGRDLLKSLQDSPHHFLRWRAVQALLKLHTPDGIEAVRKAGADAHPHVRRAAARTLSNLEAHSLLQGI